MSKRLEKMRSASSADWCIADVEALCREFGVRCQPPRSGGSHYKISHAGIPMILTIPSKRPIKAVYIKMLVAFIDQARTVQ
jgi:hypothetical protein